MAPTFYARTRSSTNRRIAEDKFPLWRDLLISLVTGNENEIYGHFTCDDEAGPFQCTRSAVFLLLRLRRRLEILNSHKGPARGPFLLMVSGDNLGRAQSIPFYRHLRPSVRASRER